MVTAAMKLKDACCLEEILKKKKNLDSALKNRDITDQGPYNQSYDFSISHVWM